MKLEYAPNPRNRVHAPFSMKWTLILSTATFLASTLMATIDDDTPRLVVWAGTVQFIVTLVIAAIHVWRSSLNRQGIGEAKSAVGPETLVMDTAPPELRIRD